MLLIKIKQLPDVLLFITIFMQPNDNKNIFV